MLEHLFVLRSTVSPAELDDSLHIDYVMAELDALAVFELVRERFCDVHLRFVIEIITLDPSNRHALAA